MKYKKDIYDIISDAGMSARPGFYSGRGAIIDDLNGRILEKLHTGIKSAKNFVMMVAGLSVLSATDFLLALFRLERNEWKWEPANQPKTNDIAFENEGEAMGTVLQVMGNLFGGRSERNETGAIRGEFLRNHREENPKLDEEYNDAFGYFRRRRF